MAGIIRRNRLRWFGRVQRRNNDVRDKKMGETGLESNRRRVRPEKKWTEVIGENLRGHVK